MKIRLLASACLFAAILPAAAAPRDVTIDDTMVFPESLSATPKGTLYVGAMGTGRVYRARPGETYATPWISKADGNFTRILGVLADAKTNTLYVCDDGASTATLKTFALDSGKAKKSYDFPGGGTCNDISLKNGEPYVTDTGHGRILRLARGADVLTVWYSNPGDPSLDGLVWARDGKLYADTYRTNHLIRIDVNADGSAGKGTVLQTSLPLFQPDGLRLSADGQMLLVEGQGRPGAGLKEGRLDEITVSGDSATIKVLKGGFELPTAVTPVGHTLYVLEAKLDYQRNADLKTKNPGSFKIYAVPAK